MICLLKFKSLNAVNRPGCVGAASACACAFQGVNPHAIMFESSSKANHQHCHASKPWPVFESLHRSNFTSASILWAMSHYLSSQPRPCPVSRCLDRPGPSRTHRPPLARLRCTFIHENARPRTAKSHVIPGFHRYQTSVSHVRTRGHQSSGRLSPCGDINQT